MDDTFNIRLQLALWGAIAGGLVSLVANMVLNTMIPRIRRWNLTRKIRVYAEPTHGMHARLRVVNGGYWTLGNSMCYISIEATADDVLPPPNGEQAFVTPGEFIPLEEMQLCWSVWSPTINPMKVDIYAKERQPLSPCAFGENYVMIPSEHGWLIPNSGSRIARVFLRRKRYTAVLKFVSADSNARCFRLMIDPDNTVMPLTIAAMCCPSV
ncbi:MAG: hypothetical protein NTZ32_15350 [Planctomycetales bacterium]|nr:hypothetical protein [Planctomycetales bacterium]